MRLFFPKCARVSLPQADVQKLHSLYEAGCYLRAYEYAQKLPPAVEWEGAAAQVIAGRIANNVGGSRFANAIFARAWRENRDDPYTSYYRALHLLHSGRLRQALGFIEAMPEFADAAPEHVASILTVRADAASMLKDFDRAEAFLKRAEASAGAPEWVAVTRASVFHRADRYADALAAGREALAIKPWYRPAVQATAAYLMLLDRDEEAIALLREGAARMESASVVEQLASLLMDREQFAEAREMWEKARGLSPMEEKEGREWWHGRVSDVHYHLGDYPAAVEHAREAGKGFHEKLAGRLAECLGGQRQDWRRVHLKVPFVRQHDMTCAPATLSAICGYWGVQVDHVALAQRICYDGTPGHVERNWVEENGFVVREFCVDWEIARALLDRGVPFVISTVETASAHAQALVGYDERRGTLIIRDPYMKLHSECHAEPWLKRYAAFGPRGLVFVPASEKHRLEGLPFRECELYDLAYQVDRALESHQGATADEALVALERTAPGHRITLFCRRRLAGYNANTRRSHEAGGELLALFPENNHLRWARAWSLRDLAPKAEHRAYLAGLATDAGAEPLFWHEYGDELRKDARTRTMARRWFYRALHAQPLSAEFLSSYANLLWDEREFATATQWYRVAASLRDKVEGFSQQWFLAARHLKTHGEALSVMERRFEEFGAMSSNPVRTLFWALCVLDRNKEAFEKLEAGLRLRPEDGELLLYAADMHARHGNRAEADRLLEAAQNRSNQVVWLRVAAGIREYACDLRGALDQWRTILDSEPLAMDAQHAVARLIAQLEGHRSAVSHLDEQCSRFPHHVLLQRMRVEALRADGAEAAEAALGALLGLDANDEWAHRELALLLAERRRFDEALAECDIAAAIAPEDTSTPAVRADVLRMAGRMEDAAEAARSAIRLSVDNGSAIFTLIRSSESFEAKKEALAFVRGELIAQTVYGDGLLAYHSFAFAVLPPEELLANLREALDARPDLWHAWSAVAAQLLNMGDAAAAVQLAATAVERFPLLPRVWHDLGRAQVVAREHEKGVEAFRQALAISPGWSMASRSLADLLQLLGRYDEARSVMEAAIAASPLDAQNHCHLAEVLWRKDRSPAAIEKLRHVIKLDPGYQWAWERLAEWTGVGGAESEVFEQARGVTEDRPGDASAWLRLASILPHRRLDEALSAVGQALALEPRHVGAHDLRAMLLSNAGRFDEAVAACSPEVYQGTLPVPLEARAAWVNNERGFKKQAVDLMRAVVARAPDFEWGWEMLAVWSHDAKDHAAERDAALQLVRLSPHKATPYAYLAQAEQSLGNRDAALAALQRAWEADPSFEFPAYQILDMQMDAKADAEVEATLQKLHTHLPGARTMVCEMRYRKSKRDKEATLRVFEQVLITPDPSGIAMQSAYNVIHQAGWAKEAAARIASNLNHPDIQRGAGACYAMLLSSARDGDVQSAIRAIPTTSPVGTTAWSVWLQSLGEKKDVKTLKSLVRDEREHLQATWELWNATGNALLQCGEYNDAWKWMEDWRQRADAPPWALQNVAVTLRCLENDKEAYAVSEHAVTLPRDSSYNFHHAWLAVDSAIANRVDGWKAHRESLAHGQITPYEKSLLVLARCVVDVASSAEEERPKVFERCRRKMRSEEYLEQFKFQDVTGTVFRALESMSSLSGVRYTRAKWLKSLPQPRRQVERHDVNDSVWERHSTFIIILVIIIIKVLIMSSK